MCGNGLSFIIIIKSSLNFNGSSGIAHTLTSFGASSSFFTNKLSGSIWKIPFLYSGLFVVTALIKLKSNLQSNFPWLDILKVVEFIFLMAGFYLSAGFLPISKGPKSKQFSYVTYTLCK